MRWREREGRKKEHKERQFLLQVSGSVMLLGRPVGAESARRAELRAIDYFVMPRRY